MECAANRQSGPFTVGAVAPELPTVEMSFPDLSTPEIAGEKILIRASHYWPELGGVNCSHFVNGHCTSHMANGQPWEDHVGYAIACPPEWQFGTKLIVNGETWECMDRGGKIQIEDGIAWVDFLIPSINYPYGAILDAVLVLKGK